MERMQQKSECDFAKIMLRASKSIERYTHDWVAPSPSKSLAEQPSHRFEREAHAISSLKHPNICTLYDLWPNSLVMELVAGETVRNQRRQVRRPHLGNAGGAGQCVIIAKLESRWLRATPTMPSRFVLVVSAGGINGE